MEVSLQQVQPEACDADLICLGLFEDEGLPDWLRGAPGGEDASSRLNELTVVRPGRPARVLVVGLGARGELDEARARGAAAHAVRQAGRFRAGTMAWLVPGGASIAAAITGATILASHKPRTLKSEAGPDARDPAPARLLLLGAEGAEEHVRIARAAALAANRARDLQNLPANVADPAFLAARAEEIAADHEAVDVEILSEQQLRDLGMGGLCAVAAGSRKEALLIVLRYHGNPGGETLGIVGKSVTFDSGGLSLKPATSMREMKTDMSGGAAALEATAAIAELGLGIELLTVLPAVENMPDGAAMRPGDVITQLNGLTVQVDNTDAEGRLALADALTWCVQQGAERIVDIATLTGAASVALGSTYAPLICNDDAWAAAVSEAGEIVGEPLWRLPLHHDYRKLMEGTVADLTNSSTTRKAGAITGGAFLAEFVAETPWAHLDIAGTSRGLGGPLLGEGPSGFGTRLLVELARRQETPS